MSNAFEVTDWLSMECLDLLTNKLELGDSFNTDYNKEFTKDYAVGDTVRIPYPAKFSERTGLGYSPQGIERIHTTVTINQIFGVDFEWDSVEAALELTRGREKISKEILDPAMAVIKQGLESRCALWAYQNTNNIVGVLGTDPTSFTPSAQARQRMMEMAALKGPKKLFIPPSVNTSLVPANFASFLPPTVQEKQYKEGMIGRQGNFDWFESVSLYTHTSGTWSVAAAVTVNGNNQSGTSLNINCTAGDTFKQGDVVGIANVYRVNPMTRRINTQATTFTAVVQADVTAAGATTTLSILPGIVGPGSPYQNVNALPVSAALLTLFPGTANPNAKTGTQGIAIGPDAFALVGVKLENPKACELSSYARDPNTGLTVSFVRMFDPIQRKMVNRFDCAVGFGNLYTDYSVRYLSA